MSRSSAVYKVAAIDGILAIMKEKTATTNSAGQSTIGIANQLRNSVEAFGRMSVTPNPTMTKAGHEKAVAAAAKKLKAQAVDANEQFQSIVRNGLKDIQTRIDAKIDMRPSAHAQEIRAVFRGLSHTDRLQLLKELAKANDGPSLAAIVNVPTVLSGITPELQQVYREDIVRQHAPAEYDEQIQLMEGLLSPMAVSGVAIEVAETFVVGPGLLAKIEEAIEASNSAQNAFDQSTRAA